MRAFIAMGAAVCFGSAVVACGGSVAFVNGAGDSGDSSSPTSEASLAVGGDASPIELGAGSTCLQGETTATALCTSCIDRMCSSQLSIVQSACSAELSCVEGCGCPVNLPCAESCLQMAPSACTVAATALGTCAEQSCVSACYAASGTDIETADAGGDCSALSSCCGKLPSTVRSGCDTLVMTNVAAACNKALSDYQSAALCP